MSGDGRVERAIRHLELCLGKATKDEIGQSMSCLVGLIIARLRNEELPDISDVIFLLGLEHAKHLGARMRAEKLVDENRLLRAENEALRFARDTEVVRRGGTPCPACSGPLVITEVGPYCPTCAEAEQVRAGGAP